MYCRFIFTADPKGRLKLWRLCDPFSSDCYESSKTNNVFLIVEFSSCFGARIMCLDASFEDEVSICLISFSDFICIRYKIGIVTQILKWITLFLIVQLYIHAIDAFLFLKETFVYWLRVFEYVQVLFCGDLRGNLVLFPLLRDLLNDKSVALHVELSPLNYFKGAHGISTVSNVSVAKLRSNQTEIRSVWPKINLSDMQTNQSQMLLLSIFLKKENYCNTSQLLLFVLSIRDMEKECHQESSTKISIIKRNNPWDGWLVWLHFRSSGHGFKSLWDWLPR